MEGIDIHLHFLASQKILELVGTYPEFLSTMHYEGFFIAFSSFTVNASLPNNKKFKDEKMIYNFFGV